MTTTCLQLVDERDNLIMRCALEAGHSGHHKPRGWTTPTRRRRSALDEAKRLILNEEETRDRLAQLMRGDDA